jgi:hypothetical protein
VTAPPPPHEEPYPYPYGGPPPPKKSHTGLKVGLAIGAVVVLLCCGALGVGGFLVYRAAASPKVVAAAWFESWQTHRTDLAYDLLCKRDRAVLGVADLDEVYFRENLESYSLGSVTTKTVHGTKRAEVPYTVTTSEGGTTSGTLLLVDEKGWKVCDLASPR